MSSRPSPPSPSASPTPGQRARSLAGRALRVELRIYESLWRAVARRPRISEGSTGFRYHKPVLAVLVIFIVLSAVEIPIIDAIVHRWVPVRIAILALGIWGLTWMIGVYCAYLTRPHTVGPDGIRVREGLELDILVRWEDLRSIRMHQSSIDPSDPERPKGRVLDDEGERVCAIRIANETNLEISFERPTTVRLPGLRPKGGEHRVTRLRFWADDPRGLLLAAREYLE